MARLLPEALPLPWSTDRELVCAVRHGEDTAFEELFSRYRGRIRSYVSGILADGDHAEDITQEVFISALRRLRDTERPIAFKPWIYEIAKNACIDDFRRTKRTQEVPIDGDDELAGGNPRLVGKAPTPEHALEKSAAAG